MSLLLVHPPGARHHPRLPVEAKNVCSRQHQHQHQCGTASLGRHAHFQGLFLLLLVIGASL